MQRARRAALTDEQRQLERATHAEAERARREQDGLAVPVEQKADDVRLAGLRRAKLLDPLFGVERLEHLAREAVRGLHRLGHPFEHRRRVRPLHHRRERRDDRLILPVLGELEQFVFRQLTVLHQPLDKRQRGTKIARTFSPVTWSLT